MGTAGKGTRERAVVQLAITGGGGFIGSHCGGPACASRPTDVAGHRRAARAGRKPGARPTLKWTCSTRRGSARPVGRLRRGLPPGRGVPTSTKGRGRPGVGRSGSTWRARPGSWEAARHHRCGRVILASTVWVYGSAAGHRRTGRGLPRRPAAAPGTCTCRPSSRRKLLVHSYKEMFGQEFTILRYGIPYGPAGCAKSWLSPGSSRRCLSPGPSPSRAPASSSATTCTWRDLADAHVRSPRPGCGGGRCLALEGGTPVSVREIAETVQQAHRACSGALRSGPRCRLPGRQRCPTGPRKSCSTGPPQTPFVTGVRRYLDWLGQAGAPGRGAHLRSRPRAAPMSRRARAAVGLARRRARDARQSVCHLADCAGLGHGKPWTPCGCSAPAAGPQVRRCSAPMLATPGLFRRVPLRPRCARGAGWALLADAGARRQFGAAAAGLPRRASRRPGRVGVRHRRVPR